MTPQIHISLVLEEELIDINLLTLLHNLGATASWQKGELKPNTTLVYLNNGCRFQYPVVVGFSLEEALLSFLEFFTKEHPQVLKIVENYQLTPTLSVAVYFNDITPSIHLTNQLLKTISQINSELNIDLILTDDISLEEGYIHLTSQ